MKSRKKLIEAAEGVVSEAALDLDAGSLVHVSDHAVEKLRLAVEESKADDALLAVLSGIRREVRACAFALLVGMFVLLSVVL